MANVCDQSSSIAFTSPNCSSGVKTKHNDLSFKLKYKVIKTFEREKIGLRKLAALFNCGNN